MAACDSPSEPAPVTEAPIVNRPGDTALPAGVHALSGLAPTLPSDDIEAALEPLGRPDVIALGETVHTSEGYAEARVRILRHLIEHQGIRAVGFESSWRSAEVTRAYVERGEGTLAAARFGLTFRAWQSRATSDFLAWLSQYNREHPTAKVTVFGFDMQDPAGNASYLRAFLSKAAPTQRERAKPLDACLGARFESMIDAAHDPVDGPLLRIETPMPPARHQDCLTGVEQIRQYLTAHASELGASSSEEELRLAQFAAQTLSASDREHFYATTDLRKSFEARDETMADGVALMRDLRAKGERIALVAHNEHVMRARDFLVTQQYDWKSMGSWLAGRWGDKYAPIGLFARQVAFDWDGSGVTELPPRDGAHDVERPLHALGRPYLFVDLARTDVFAPGQSYTFSDMTTGVPATHFRALVFLERSEPFAAP